MSGLTLAMGAAEGQLMLAFGDADGRLLLGQSLDAPAKGVELLSPAIEADLALIGKKAADICRVAAVAGPGSFTGLRLTAATAAGLARVLRIPQGGIDTLDVLALEALPCMSLMPDACLWTMMRARRDLLYLRAYSFTSEHSAPAPLSSEAVVMTLASGEAEREIISQTRKAGKKHLLCCGSGVKEGREILEKAFAASGLGCSFLPIVTPGPAALLAAARNITYSSEDIAPLYLRPSDAEANLPQIAGRLGLDPAKAVAALYSLTHSKPDSGACE